MSERSIDRCIGSENTQFIFNQLHTHNTHRERSNWLAGWSEQKMRLYIAMPIESNCNENPYNTCVRTRAHTHSHFNSIFPKWSYRILFYSTHTYIHTCIRLHKYNRTSSERCCCFANQSRIKNDQTKGRKRTNFLCVFYLFRITVIMYRKFVCNVQLSKQKRFRFGVDLILLSVWFFFHLLSYSLSFVSS